MFKLIRWCLGIRTAPPRPPEPMHVIAWHPSEHVETIALRAVGYAEAMNRVVRIEGTQVHVFPQSTVDDVVTLICFAGVMR